MRLAINVGNTNVQYGYQSEGDELRYESVPVGGAIPDVEPTGEVWVASVNPVESDRIAKSRPNWKLRVLSCREVSGRLAWNYTDPRTLGADRLANLIALSAYPLPALAIDAGTATTFELLVSPGIGHAGPILPGPGLMLMSLNQTAQLPLVRDQSGPTSKVSAIHGTESAIAIGISLAHVGAVREVVRSFAQEWQLRTIVLTGGARHGLQAAVEEYGQETQEDPGLTLRGLLQLALD